MPRSEGYAYGSYGTAATRSFASQNRAVDALNRIQPYGVEARVKGGHICVVPAGEGSVLLVFFQNNSGEIHVALVGESDLPKVMPAAVGGFDLLNGCCALATSSRQDWLMAFVFAAGDIFRRQKLSETLDG
jgi:hypothetical protein